VYQKFCQRRNFQVRVALANDDDEDDDEDSAMTRVEAGGVEDAEHQHEDQQQPALNRCKSMV
jgi:hypothetical protein